MRTMLKSTKRVLKEVWLISRKRWSSECTSGGTGRSGLVVGIYQTADEHCETVSKDVQFTPTGAKINEATGGKLKELVADAGIKKGVARVITNISNEFQGIAVTGVGPEGVGWNDVEKLDECKENIRIATAHAVRTLQDEGFSTIFVEPFTNAEAAAESATLSVWRYQDLKKSENQLPKSKVDLYGDDDKDGWERGKLKSDNQNLARRLEETPANLMTPTIFAEQALDSACACGINIDVKDRDWIEGHRMNAFLTVAKGSCEPPLFIELGYCAGDKDAKSLVLMGKGITFDSGGLCLKNCPNMSEYRGDMAGAAVVLAVIKTIAQMALPINVIGLIPLCENMIGGLAVKPGDVVMLSNGKSIAIEDTDNEGRLLIADTLIYSDIVKPCGIIEIATMTPGIRRCLGTSASGTFSLSEEYWRELERAGGETGDRLWRFPFWNIFKKRVTDYLSVDVHNVGRGKMNGNVGKAAAFTWAFTPVKDYVHIDITGTGLLSNGVGHPYLREGQMTGRPTRTLVQFLYQIACPHTKIDC